MPEVPPLNKLPRMLVDEVFLVGGAANGRRLRVNRRAKRMDVDSGGSTFTYVIHRKSERLSLVGDWRLVRGVWLGWWDDPRMPAIEDVTAEMTYENQWWIGRTPDPEAEPDLWRLYDAIVQRQEHQADDEVELELRAGQAMRSAVWSRAKAL